MLTNNNETGLGKGLMTRKSEDFPGFFDEPLEIVSTKAISIAGVNDDYGLFARHQGVPGHDQSSLNSARVALIGAGGLNSHAAVGLARSGMRYITIIDGDRVDPTNLSRQLYTEEDLGHTKGPRLARNIAVHAVGGAQLSGVGLEFEDAIEAYPIPADIFVAGVDNNECRLAVVKEARRRRIPAVFTMLSRDGMRCQAFLQSASPDGPCLWCALPNLDPKHRMPCASAIITTCFLAASFTVFFVHRALMGWRELEPFNWREADLSGIAPDRIGRVDKRAGCPVCASEG